MGGALKNLPKFLSQTLEHLKPGGWIEWQEYETTVTSDDNTIPEKFALGDWTTNVNTAAAKIGQPTNIAVTLGDVITQAGFKNVKDQVYKVSIY